MSKVKDDLEKINKMRENLRDYLIAEISKIQQNPNINTIGSNFFTIKLSEIKSNNYNLSPFYHNFESQKKLVIERIKNAHDEGYSYLNHIIETKRDRNTKEYFHPDFIKQIKEIIEK